MMRARRVTLIAGCASLLLVSCAHNNSTTQPSVAGGVMVSGGTPSIVFQEVLPGQTIAPDDELRCLVTAIQVTAPAGTISQDPAFWQTVTGKVGTAEFNEMLAGNGIRTGMMQASDWQVARKAMEGSPNVISRVSTLKGPGRVELEVKSVVEQTVFHYDLAGTLHGRSYEASDNFWGLLFSPDPTKRERIFVEALPVVRSARRQMRFNRVGGDYELDFLRPESIHDLGFRTSVDVGSVIVIAPNATAMRNQTSVGHAFLTFEEDGMPVERLIFLHPKLFRLNVKATENQFDEVIKRIEREGFRYDQPASR